MSEREVRRVRSTLALVPPAWRSIIDVGCGDGRVSGVLSETGVEVFGIDWSTPYIKQFSGKKVVADIRKRWPLKEAFDGAICTEVLEHFPIAESKGVLSNIKEFTRLGFIVSVPARELLPACLVNCLNCKEEYHLWGHLLSFASFEEVDNLVGERSNDKKFVPNGGMRSSLSIDRWRRRLGHSPYADFSSCPYCGARLTELSKKLPPLQRGAIKVLNQVEKLTSFSRKQTGWFVCRYDR